MNGAENWSWAATQLTGTPVHGGAKSLAVTAKAWEAAYFHKGGIDANAYSELSFWIHGGAAGGQKLLVQGLSSGAAQGTYEIPALPANTWQEIRISLEKLGVAGDPNFDGFWVQDRSGTAQGTFYMDDVVMLPGSGTAPQTNGAVTLQIDAAANNHPISEFIYGVAFATAEQLQALNVPLNRSGGNSESRYNWQLNAHNRGFDWYFESLADASATSGAETDSFIEASKSSGAEPMITVPMLGWAAKLGPNRGRLASFSIAKYGAQTDRDAQWFPDAGNGISAASNQPITNNDPNDANLPVDALFQQDWVRHLTNKWGASGKGGVRFYIMDNEPSIWHATHRDVFKTGLRMSELRDRFIDYAAKVRDVDAGAVIAGPEEWGWSGYLYSGYDQQWGATHGWSNLPDRTANGGMEYLPWFLDQMRQRDAAAGRRLLDIFTVHYYPQGGEYSSTVSSAMQQRRNRSTRSLWDPNYTDESWISDKVRLIPRLKEWVNRYYPGTKIGITEYSWGADSHMNGATAQAELLGIFGREGLDYATRWVVPATGTPAFRAIQMFRNYDGKKSHFGENSVSATGPNPDNVAVFAAKRSSDGALTVLAINKSVAATPVTVVLTNFTVTGTAGVWQLTGGNPITELSDVPVAGSALTSTLPAQSITLWVLPGGSAGPQIAFSSVSRDGGALSLKLSGTIGMGCRIERSADCRQWTVVTTVQFNTPEVTVNLPVGTGPEFFRAVTE